MNLLTMPGVIKAIRELDTRLTVLEEIERKKATGPVAEVVVQPVVEAPTRRGRPPKVKDDPYGQI